VDIAPYWKTIVDTLHDGLLVIDTEGRIVAVNPAAERLTGYRADELVGRSCRVLGCTGCQVWGRGPGLDWCTLYAKGSVRARRCMITTRDGRSVHVVKNAQVLRDSEGLSIGAVETLTDVSEMIRREEEIAALRQSCRLEEGFHGMIGESPVMRRMFALIESVANSEAPVLVQGPSGSGKELAARAIHESGPRRDKPFIKVNCAALNENLLESELFGHVRGAFTGADRTRVGRFEAAHEGTILLDEIGDIPPATQVRLLRVLEEREIERVGDHRPIPVDVRVITATHRNLDQRVAEGRFRQDLFFRINVFPIHCPALNERTEDIPRLVQHILDRTALRGGRKVLGLAAEAMERMTAYSWPGNVRELRNAIEYAFVLCPDQWIGPEHLPPRVVDGKGAGHSSPPARSGVSSGEPAGMPSEKRALIAALRETGGNRSEAGRILGVSRVTVWKRIKKYGVDVDAVVASAGKGGNAVAPESGNLRD
jgi:PAS domain S-box-containing protein